jgi:hypothetical protein
MSGSIEIIITDQRSLYKDNKTPVQAHQNTYKIMYMIPSLKWARPKKSAPRWDGPALRLRKRLSSNQQPKRI